MREGTRARNPMPFEPINLAWPARLWLTNLRYKWSRIRHRNSIKTMSREDTLRFKPYIPKTINDVRDTAREINSRFQWTMDSWDRLYDSIDSPASCWSRAFNNPPLLDDCDGFHSALYWAVSFYMKCRLLTVATKEISQSHSVLVIKFMNTYYLVNYTYVSRPLPSMDAVLKDLDRQHYRGNMNMIAWELSKWNGEYWESGSL